MFASFTRFRHLVPLVAVQAVGLACGLISVRWSSTLVPPNVLGVYGVLLSTQFLGATVTHQGFIKYLQRRWTSEGSLPLHLRILRGHVLRPTVGLAVGLIGMYFLIRLDGGVALSPLWLVWMFATNLLVTATHAVHAALQSEERYWDNFSVSTIGSVTRSFLPLVGAVLYGASIPVLGLGYLLHTCLWVVAGLWFLRAAWHRPETALAEGAGSPASLLGTFAIAGLFGWLGAASPRWIAALALDPEKTGYFMLALNLTMIVPSAVSLVGQSYTFPLLFQSERAGAGTAELFNQTNRAVSAVLGIGQTGLFALALCGRYLVGPLIAARYGPSVDWLLAAGGATLATVTSGFYCNLLMARNRERHCQWLTGASCLLRLVVMAGLALVGKEDLFRFGLAALAWPTVALEYWLTRWWLRDA